MGKEAPMSFKDLLDTARRRLGLADSPPEFSQVPQENIRLTNPWHAVAIQPGPKRCKAVEALAGNRPAAAQPPPARYRLIADPMPAWRRHVIRDPYGAAT
jgi:hypothetical protein